MMKIGVLTRRAGYNMGSSLQAYAMAEFVKSLGCQCQIVDYDEYSGHKLWKIRPFIEDIEWNSIRKMPWLKQTAKYGYLSIRHNQYVRFGEFEQKYLPLTTKRYKSKKQLSAIVNDFDALVCGSDQIWSPLLYDPVYYFNFIPSNLDIRTVAYAPSIGISNSDLMTKKQAELIKKIDYISCREQEGAKILEHITGREVPVVLDPTLMVGADSWNKILHEEDFWKDTPYLLCYFLGKNIHQEYVSKVSEHLHCKIFNIRMFNRFNDLRADYHFTDIGPCEFLGLIKNAKWVCTDSFHCVIFSCIFQKQLSIFERFNRQESLSQNSRIYSLMDILHLEEFLCGDACDVELDREAEYSKIREAMERWQKSSLDFMNKALSVKLI